MSGLESIIESVLRGEGLTDKPAEYDGDIHSWRCSHPDIYGRCDCFQELAEDIAAAVRDAEQRITRAHHELADTTATDALRISRAMVALGERGPELLDALDRDLAADRVAVDAPDALNHNAADSGDDERTEA